ncbi:MAG: Rieske 2Fe-2S domain-containing protein [Cyanobacteria bacterium P01_A01_bin.45]
MELAPKLTGQMILNPTREVGINPSYWYPVKICKIPISFYQVRAGKRYPWEDTCYHEGSSLNFGDVTEENLAYSYYGWQFNRNGDWVIIAYSPKGENLSCTKARVYHVKEKYSIPRIFTWCFSIIDNSEFLEILKSNEATCLLLPIPGDSKAHFFICNENTMDVLHGYLHRNFQGWLDPVLINLRQNEASVLAQYQVSYQSWMAKFLELSKNGNQVTTRTISVKYNYPDCQINLEGVSSLYLMRFPVESDSNWLFVLMLLQLHFPKWLLKPIIRSGYKNNLALSIPKFFCSRY